MRIPAILCGLGLGVGLMAGACKPGGSQETDAGTNDEGDTEDCTPGAEGCVCGDDASCEPGLLCASNTCIPHDAMTTSGPTSAVTTTEDTHETSTPTETSGHSTESTDTSTSECDPAQGVLNPACGDAAAPYCSADGVCAPCDAVDCADVSADTPTCDTATGACVQCTATDESACGGTTPICDAASSSCVACTDHEQCESGACQLLTGACFERSLFVDRGADCAAGNGTTDMPFCEISEAAAEVMGEPTVIRVKSSPGPYTAQVQIPPGSTLAIVRNGSGTVKLEVSALDSMVINDGATVYLSSLQISKGEVNKGLYCTVGAKLWLDGVQVVDRKGLGIEGVECELTLRRSRVYLNLGGGIKLNGGKLRLENSFVVTNGGSFAAVAGIVTSNGASVSALYSTIADNDGKAGVEDSLDCVNPGAVSLRNSIVFGQSAASSVDCAMATATTSVVDSAKLTGEGNTTLNTLMPEWFVAPETGNFAVQAGAPFEGVGVWKAGDPTSDYDGDPRPTREGTADYVGADRPK